MILEKLNWDLPQDSIFTVSDIAVDFYSELNKKLENFMIEALKRKGFEFTDRFVLEDFIKSNCRCEDNVVLKERVYFANNIPFFLHKYKIEMDLNPKIEDNTIKMSANLGYYAYL